MTKYHLTGIFSGKYEDDFESTLTTENVTSTDGRAEGAATTDSLKLVQDADGDSNDVARDDARCSEGVQSDFDESEGEDGEDTLTVSFQDISTLRRSLELDHMIRESLASERSNNVSGKPSVYTYTMHTPKALIDIISAIKHLLIMALYKC
jgi:hypothetical protein